MTTPEAITGSPLLEMFDIKTADDAYLKALAEEYHSLAADKETKEAAEIAHRYERGMGIIPSNNLHTWFNDRVVDPTKPLSELYNMHSPQFASWPGVQGLRMLRDDQPDLFEEVKGLAAENSTLRRQIVDNALGRAHLSEKEQYELAIAGTVSSFKLNLAKTRVITVLQEMGVSEEALQELYR